MSLILVTGMPGVGKTTIMRKLSVELRKHNVPIAGFYTEEIRDPKSGDRIGFDVVTFAGQRSPLARTTGSHSSNPTVGRYSVWIDEFERLAIPALHERHSAAFATNGGVLLLDEIGRMELKSRTFQEHMNAIVKEVNAGKLRFVATVPLKSAGIEVIERLKRIGSCQMFHVKPSNRDDMYGDAKDAVLRLISS